MKKSYSSSLSWKKMPLKHILQIAILCTSTAALVLAALAFGTYEWSNMKSDMVADLTAHAQIIGSNTRAALLFSDANSAAKTLASLVAKPHISSATLYSSDGKAFASYFRPEEKNKTVPQKPALIVGHRFLGDRLELAQAITQDNETIGTIVLTSDMDEFFNRIFLFLRVVLLVTLLSILGAMLLGNKLQSLVSGPILKLADAARQVYEKRDYSIRVEQTLHNEIGVLTRSFNEMLSEIQRRELALRHSEEYFRALIENASDIISILSNEGLILYTSPALQRITGFLPESVQNKSWNQYIHPDDLPAMSNFLAELRASEKVATIEFRHYTADNKWIYLQSVGRSLLHHESVKGVVINSRDITEQREAQQKLQTYAEKLERSNRDLQDFAYLCSHDLQEPLRKIQAFGDRLKDKFQGHLGKEGLEYLLRMQDAASRMQILINDLLQYSRISTKTQPFIPVNLEKIAQEVLSDLEVAIERHKGRVELVNLPTIDADPLQMRQFFQNLVGNALKFHKDNEPPVIRLEGLLKSEKGANQVELVVSDNGIGFEDKYADQIFGIFQRLHGRSQYEGTGVGLAIVKKIVERHGGTIVAKSEPGQGATFIACLPVKHVPEAPV